MNTLFETTPISIVKETRMHWKLELDIHPIDMQCVDGLTERLENDRSLTTPMSALSASGVRSLA